MRVIEEQAVEVLVQQPGIQGIYEHIKKAAELCNKTVSGDAAGFAKQLVKSGGASFLRHATVYLTTTDNEIAQQYLNGNECIDPMTSAVACYDSSFHIVSDYLRIIERGWQDDLKHLSGPVDGNEVRVTMALTIPLAVFAEITRNAPKTLSGIHAAVTAEHPEECAYDSAVLGDGLTFIIPSWLASGTIDKMDMIEWMNTMQDTENHYMRLRAKGCTPEECSMLLNGCTKVTVVMTMFEYDWMQFINSHNNITVTKDMGVLLQKIKSGLENRNTEFS